MDSFLTQFLALSATYDIEFLSEIYWNEERMTGNTECTIVKTFPISLPVPKFVLGTVGLNNTEGMSSSSSDRRAPYWWIITPIWSTKPNFPQQGIDSTSKVMSATVSWTLKSQPAIEITIMFDRAPYSLYASRRYQCIAFR